jgi:RNA polymerase sigma-70 factor (ECF subfamily)
VRFDPRHTASAALVVRAALGDPASLDRLLREIQEPLYDHITFLMGDGDAASDVLQDVLLIVCRSLISLQDPLLFRAWVFRIATRAALSAVRRARRGTPIPLEAALDLPTDLADEPAFDAVLIAALPTLVAELPPACGVVVRLRYLEELSIAEVAEALTLPPGTVKSRAAYGVSLLRQRLAAAPR